MDKMNIAVAPSAIQSKKTRKKNLVAERNLRASVGLNEPCKLPLPKSYIRRIRRRREYEGHLYIIFTSTNNIFSTEKNTPTKSALSSKS